MIPPVQPEVPVEGSPVEAPARAENKFSALDVETILREHGWLLLEVRVTEDPALQIWFARAAEFLGPHSLDRDALTELLSLFFCCDAAARMQQIGSQSVMSREGARDVIREIANRLLDGGDIDSERLNEIVDSVKKSTPYRSREIFHPLRLALAGRVGEGELDRVILLIDFASKLNFAAPVKSCRQRMIEFCAALD
jgi:hypothetical protein